MPISQEDDCYLNANQIMARYGQCSHMWIIRRQADSGFPAAVYFGRNRFWKISDLIAWERKQAAKPAPVNFAKHKPPQAKVKKKRAA